MILWRRRGRRRERFLVRETEAFLTGQIHTCYAKARRPAPNWAELNWLTHGHPDQIRERVLSESGLERPNGSWQWATSVLARELLHDGGGRNDVIALLQRDCLIPMELVLLDHDHNELLPAHLVALGVPKLRSHPAVDQDQ